LIGVFAIYLLSITACGDERVEVIPGGINSVAKAEGYTAARDTYYTKCLIAFNWFLDI